jgi:CHAT domain-containing protein
VLISDSESSLRLTAAGIRQLFTDYYPAARVFGNARSKLPARVPGSVAATPADVLAALPGAHGPGASLLHFGCHGQAAVPVLRSRLSLGAGGAVAVQDILSQARSFQAEPTGQQGRAGGLVVLASCLTDVTEADYDEALTLASAFLAAGASGVVAARWRVAESATALFMTAFHRYLNPGPGGPGAGGRSPARALRAAQQWMLDPHREIPGGLPAELRDEAELAAEPGGPDLTSPAAWAGFGYLGR